MKLGFIGTGYVGLVSGVGFGELGNDVVCVDIDEKKIELINKGVPPIFENGLEEMLKRLIASKKLVATTDTEMAVANSEILFICTGTPSREDGSIDLRYIKSAAENVGKALKNSDEFKTVVVKSTVVPGTTRDFVLPILEKHSGKKAGVDFGVAMNPEFLKEGVAIEDFQNPDRVVLGTEDPKSLKMLRELYSFVNCEILETDTATAEMIKYASNSFLAVKISFINEIANMCEKMGADVNLVAQGMGMDDRISPKFLRPGIGYGGSCFPKDVKALRAAAEEAGVTAKMLSASLEVNKVQPSRAVELLKKHMDPSGKTIALLGMAFKPDTDDMRESRAIPLAKELMDLGAKIRGYDPIAKETAKMSMPEGTEFFDNIDDLLNGADAAILVTEWNEFRELTPQFFLDHGVKYLVDGRRIYDKTEFNKSGVVTEVLGEA